jgi:hypothetical protein
VSEAPEVFISYSHNRSYSHDRLEDANQVLALASVPSLQFFPVHRHSEGRCFRPEESASAADKNRFLASLGMTAACKLLENPAGATSTSRPERDEAGRT